MSTTTLSRAGLKYVAMLAAILTSVAAFGHDPLKENHAQQHGVHNDRSDPSQQSFNVSGARALVVSFRETGDDRYLDQAWALLEPELRSAAVEPDTLLTASFVAQSRHDFSDALQLINRSLAINESNDEAWLLSASIYLVLGDAQSAARACRRLRDVPPIVLLTCNARVALATDQHEDAFVRLTGVLKIADAQRLPPDVMAWSYGVAGDLAVAAGESEQAVHLYHRSLGLAERTQVRAALVDVLLGKTRYDDAWLALNTGAPALPLLIRRLIAAKRLGRMDELESVLANVHIEFDDWIANEDWLHAREMTRFFVDVVDRPVLARRLALINVGLQKEPEDLRLERRTRPVR